jgi:SAM-dependent methyltransferase
VELCRLHPALRSEVLELPAAIPCAAVILEREEMSDRVRHRAADVLVEDLGEDVYDLVLVNNLVHHFSEEQNEELAARVLRALRPGGVFVIGDLVKGETPGEGGAQAGTMDLYFALTSTSGTWRLTQLRDWQRIAGFEALRTMRLQELPGFVLQLARKPRRNLRLMRPV